ncbi:MAG TPA: hypothetical protein VMU95_09535 [Trebonia sp.]|nr:hypothetical protein [Trebonia sp.]
MKTFNPWTAAGTLLPGIKVAETISGSSCTAGSSWDVGSPYAWECGAYFACFAPPGRTDVSQVACMSSPWSDAYLLKLTTPLASSSWGTPTAAELKYPWAVALANGQECVVLHGTGQLLDGLELNTACNEGYVTFPSTGTSPWTVKYVASGSSSPVTVAVTTAYH